jgi:hypothetical protein
MIFVKWYVNLWILAQISADMIWMEIWHWDPIPNPYYGKVRVPMSLDYCQIGFQIIKYQLKIDVMLVEIS